MVHLYYALITIFIWLIGYEIALKYFIIQEGLSDKDSELWKNNHHNSIYLERKFTELEQLKYIKENNPSLLGNHKNDKSYTITDVVKYFKSGVDDNTKQLESIAARLATTIPDPDTIKITGSN